MFGYGFLSVVLVLYLAPSGLSGAQIGLLLTLTLLGDAAISLWLTTHADRIGRRRVLLVGAVLMMAARARLRATPVFAVLLVAATIGVISPSGNEVGPFLAVEQASLTQLVDPTARTRLFAWYKLVGSFATAFGALAAGRGRPARRGARGPADAYRAVIVGYAVVGVALAVAVLRASRRRSRSRRRGRGPDHPHAARAAPLAGRRPAPVGPVRPRRVRRRVRRSRA